MAVPVLCGISSCFSLQAEQTGYMPRIGIYLVLKSSGFSFTELVHLLPPLLQTPAAPKGGWSTDIPLLPSQKCCFFQLKSLRDDPA